MLVFSGSRNHRRELHNLLFDSVREWNRANIPGYVEVYIKTSVEKLRERDQKELYSGLQKGVAYNVMGFDIQIEEPETPDIVI